MFGDDVDILEEPALSADAELERAFVGGLITWPDYVPAIAPKVHPEHIGDQTARTVYNRIRGMVAAGIPVDGLLLVTELKRCGEFEDIGGVSGISALTDAASTGENLSSYADKIITASMERKRLSVVSAASRKLCEPEHDSCAVCNDLIATLNQIAKSDFRKREARTLKDIALTCMNPENRDQLVSTGYAMLDDNSGGGLANGGFALLGAGPSYGKTQFLNNLMTQMKVGERTARILFLSLEMSEPELFNRLMALQSGLYLSTTKKFVYGQVDDELDRMYGEKFGRELEASLELPLRIVTGSQDVDSIREITNRYRDTFDILIVDYLQRIGGTRGQKTLERVEAASRALKDLAVDLNIPVIAAASLNREGYKDKNVRPDLANLRECGNIEFDADYVWMLWRDKDDPEKRETLELHVRKQRNGPLGMLEFNFNLPTGRITEKAISAGYAVN